MPRIYNVKLSDIRSAPEYQRAINTRLVKDIVDNFDENLLGVITVRKRPDGFFYVIDGQHRVAALIHLKKKTTTANIVETDREAALFKKLNTKRKSPQVVDIFRADLEDKDEESMENIRNSNSKWVYLRP